MDNEYYKYIKYKKKFHKLKQKAGANNINDTQQPQLQQPPLQQPPLQQQPSQQQPSQQQPPLQQPPLQQQFQQQQFQQQPPQRNNYLNNSFNNFASFFTPKKDVNNSQEHIESEKIKKDEIENKIQKINNDIETIETNIIELQSNIEPLKKQRDDLFQEYKHYTNCNCSLYNPISWPNCLTCNLETKCKKKINK
jgi:hypothetical protein